MTRALRTAMIVTVICMALAPISSALSPRDECEQAGGVFSKEGGTQSCVFSDTPGNNQGGVTKETEETQKGSSRSSHPEEETDCVNNHGGSHC